LSAIEGLAKVPELRKRIIFTIVMLAVYRIGVYVPTPGVDGDTLSRFFDSASNTLFGILSLFSGGAMERFSVFALGIMPYISASIILQLLTVVWPYMERLSKEGEQGRRKITQYTRYGTIGLCLVQSFGIATGLESMRVGQDLVIPNPGMEFRIMTMITLTSGTAFLMWLGEQITERGIGNGISLIIAAGIAAGIPSAFMNTITLFRSGEIEFFRILLLLVLMVATIAFIIFIERGQRRIPIQYAKRVVGRKMFGGQNSHLPLKLNVSGVIPPIFASSIIVFPTTIATFTKSQLLQDISAALYPGSLLYNVLFVLFIVFFCYFYTAVQFNPVDVAENLKKQGGYVPGIRPGKPTSDYIDRVLTRLTLAGAVYISAVCVLPSLVSSSFKVSFYFGGTSLLILVGVAMDTVQQIEAHLVTRHYDGFVKGNRMKGRRA
jgi:preprotein translocase subunit SecY